MNKPRRRFVATIAGAVAVQPLASLIRTLRAAEMATVNPDDPTAKSLNYAHQSADANKRCSDCQFYSDPSAAGWGPCVIFPDQLVNANGVCNSWFKRAA